MERKWNEVKEARKLKKYIISNGINNKGMLLIRI